MGKVITDGLGLRGKENWESERVRRESGTPFSSVSRQLTRTRTAKTQETRVLLASISVPLYRIPTNFLCSMYCETIKRCKPPISISRLLTSSREVRPKGNLSASSPNGSSKKPFQMRKFSNPSFSL
ncbi:hypothetical protein AMTRI_Chr01g114560 [Amborella trichopoda]